MPRLFVAIHPPPATAAALRGALEGLELPEHRPAPADQLHLTLLFLGEVDAREVAPAVESVERAAAGVRRFELRPERLVALPAEGPARLVAAVTDAPSALLELRKRLVGRLATKRRKVQGFLPHLTLCRFARPTAFELVAPPLAIEPFVVDEIALMESRLHPDGAEHRGLVRVALSLR